MNTYRGSRRELADLIISVQEHPLTPPVLKDNILDALMQAHHLNDYAATSEGVELCLAAHVRQREVTLNRISPQ